MKQTLAITRKEVTSYFSSPMALIFVGAFLAATLFSFFWVDTFFARGIADVRPMFRSMPLLLIFLVAALTMRQWSDEEQSGALEILLTLPVSGWQLVLGKFLAVMMLVVVSLALTLFLPITVAILGNLDWGPVFGGYLAALLLAAAYTAIGLFLSSRTDNPLVALMLTALVGGAFYVVGSSTLVDFFGRDVGNVLRALGAGSRFESIERGVIDVRDLVYYGSLTALFLLLNVVSLDSKRWSLGDNTRRYRGAMLLGVALVGANLILLNVWLYPLNSLRLDVTQDREYSLSQPTKDILGNLSEPLLIRAYISEKTHPLLAPLAPTVADMLREYEIASHGKVKAEVIDPAKHPDLEAEANQTYGIRPTPFRQAGRYETSVINSYFDILVRYGDKSTVLNFQDLIEVVPRRDGTPDVHFRNLEYDLTKAVKKVVYGFQSIDAVLAALDQPAQLTLYVTPNSLPQELQNAPQTIRQVANDIAAQSNGKFTFKEIDPTAPNSPITPKQLYDSYQIQPYAVSLFSPDTYYLNMVLQAGGAAQVVYPGGAVAEADVKSAIESGLKRSSSGFLKVVGVWSPPETPTPDMFGNMQQPLSTYRAVRQALQDEYEVRDVDLSTGRVQSDVDVLIVIAPKGFSDVERYAIDQYLMRGGAVIMSAGNYTLRLDRMSGTLALDPVSDGVQDLLKQYGVTVQQSLVMDPQNEPFPMPTTRMVNGQPVQEIRALDYPFFVDVRPDAMAKDSPIVSNLPAITVNWASPLQVDENTNRKVTELLHSSKGSWLRTNTDITPNVDQYPRLGFPVEGDTGAHTLAVSIQGSFDSYFKGKELQPAAGQTLDPNLQVGQLDTSPETARLVVVGSSEFLDDVIFNISSNLQPDRYRNSLTFAQNAVDWSVEDLDLLGIRTRGAQTRILQPLQESDQSFWEILNYLVALMALAAIGLIWNIRRRSEQPLPITDPHTGKKEA
ncbi:MAG: ABC transporter permease subunit [Chloroflexi bacterium]|nr:ABC transporter permease subunit [Chloroflexota bacterium]